MKMKKLVALLTAGVLCLGMSATVLAAPSPTSGRAEIDYGQDNNERVIGFGLTQARLDALAATFPDDADIQRLVREGEATLDILDDNKKVANILEDHGIDTKSNDVVVMGAGVYEYQVFNATTGAWERVEEIPEGSTVAFPMTGANGILGNATDLKQGDTVYVMHYYETTDSRGQYQANWEVIKGTVEMRGHTPWVLVDGLKTLSPLAFVKVMADGTVVKVDPETKKPIIPTVNDPKSDSKAPVKNIAGTTNVSQKSSPKTGEF